MRLWVWNPASGRGWLCAFLIQGPGLLVTDVCPTAQTLGGGLQAVCTCCCIHVAAAETPVGCSCPGAEPSASAQRPAVTAVGFRLAGAEVKQQRGPRPSLQPGTLPTPRAYSPSAWKVTKGQEQSLRSSSAP